MQQNEEMLTPKEAAKYLDISEITLWRRLKEMNVKPSNFNPLRKRQKDPRYSKADLEKIKEQAFVAA